MTAAALSALVPYLVLTGSLLVLLLVVSFRRSHALAMWLTVAALVATLAMLPGANAVGTQHIDGFLTIDAFANFFNGLFALAGIVTALLAYRYLDSRSTHAHREEFYILLLTATLGAMTMASAAHFAAFLLGLEIVSISLYAMIAYPEQGQAPLEAAMKYLVLSGVASTTMLFGMALVYASVGTMAFGTALGAGTDPLLIAGQVMILAGVAFKLSLVPFHMWTPDVYQGAPAPVTGFVATVSKGGVVAVLLRYVVETDMLSHETLFLAVSLIAIVSMVVGNLLALLQDNLKRILAYSSIAHIGYLLIAVLVVSTLASPAMALETGMFYLAGYFLMTLAAFGVMTVLSTGAPADAEGLSAYAGLFWRRPVLAAVLTVAALSLAGIPLTVGFIAKFYLFAAGVEGGLWALLWALVVGSAIGIYYYLRIVFSMIRTADDEAADEASGRSIEGLATAGVLGLAIVVLGIYPTPVIDLARDAVRAFGG